MWRRPLRFAARPPGATGLPKPPARGHRRVSAQGCSEQAPRQAARGVRHGGDGGTAAAWGDAAPHGGVACPRLQARGASGSSMRYRRGSQGHGSVREMEAAAFDTNAGFILRSSWSTPGTQARGQLSPRPGSTATVSHKVLLSLSSQSWAGMGGGPTLSPLIPHTPQGRQASPSPPALLPCSLGSTLSQWYPHVGGPPSALYTPQAALQEGCRLCLVGLSPDGGEKRQ